MATDGNQILGGVGGRFQADLEFVFHLGGGHFIGLEALYRYFSTYHDNSNGTINAIHSLRSAISYSYWSGHQQGRGVGFYVRPQYEFGATHLNDGASTAGSTTENHFFGGNIGIEF